MKKNIINYGLLILVAFICIGCTDSDAVPPDFSAMNNVKQKKQAFFDYMYPLVNAGNQDILITRKKILSYRDETTLNADEVVFLRRVSTEYSINRASNDEGIDFHELLKRVDYIPPSLALAQSANESAWGTSRFAIKANNFFGQWCFIEGCGVVPLQRSTGSSHEVRKFTSAQDSVRSYMKNLNSGHAYGLLRQIRLELRIHEKPVTGIALADGLIKYSSRGTEYVKEIKSMIKTNKLRLLDEAAKHQ